MHDLTIFSGNLLYPANSRLSFSELVKRPDLISGGSPFPWSLLVIFHFAMLVSALQSN